MHTDPSNNNLNAAETFAKKVDEERAKRHAEILGKLDVAIAGAATATVAAEEARDASRAAQEASEYAAKRLAPPLASRILIAANDVADKILYVIKPVAVAVAVGGGAYAAGKAIHGKVTKKAAPAPTAG